MHPGPSRKSDSPWPGLRRSRHYFSTTYQTASLSRPAPHYCRNDRRSRRDFLLAYNRTAYRYQSIDNDRSAAVHNAADVLGRQRRHYYDSLVTDAQKILLRRQVPTNAGTCMGEKDGASGCPPMRFPPIPSACRVFLLPRWIMLQPKPPDLLMPWSSASISCHPAQSSARIFRRSFVTLRTRMDLYSFSQPSHRPKSRSGTLTAR